MHAIRACFGLNRDRTPERDRQPERRRTDPPQPPQRQGVFGMMTGGKPVRSIGSAFDRMRPKQKIKWLLQASPILAEDQLFPADKIQAGTRLMSDKQALCFALELAMESNRSFVPLICKRLLQAYPAESVRFNLFGIDFDRHRLQEWTREGSLPVPAKGAAPAIVGMEAAMRKSNQQNVHSDPVMIAMAGQLLRMRQRVTPERSACRQDAEREIDKLVRSTPLAIQAQHGLACVLERNEAVPNFDMTPRDCLTLVWNYIHSLPDRSLQQRLKESLTAKLVEISAERPCALGTIERLIDIPTGIDLSLLSEVSPAALREELQRIAAKVNEEFEGEATDYIEMVRTEIGQPHISQDPDALLSEWKRDRFLQIARVEFVLLRGIDPALIQAEADRIFPPGVML